MKLFFHPGTDMAQAMAETIGYVNRSRAFMPPGTVPPFVMRFDTGSVPVGYLVLSSETKTDRRDPGPGPVQGPADVRQPPRRVGPAAVRRQPADRRRPRRPRPAARLQRLARRGGRGPDRRQHHQPLGQHPHRRRRCRSCRSTRWSCRPQELGNIPIRPGPTSTSATSAPVIEDATRHPDRLRPGQRPAGRLHPGHQAGRRLDARRRQRRQGRPAEDAGGPARRHQGQLRVRPVALRHQRRSGASASRAALGGRPDRADGAAVPARLAERDRRRAEHPARPARRRSSPCG